MEKQFRVFATDAFWKEYRKLSGTEKLRLNKIQQQLKTNPFSGKPLSYTFLREKKLDGKRLYYLIYEDRLLVLLIEYSGKKDQQQTIQIIKSRLEEYKKQVAGFD